MKFQLFAMDTNIKSFKLPSTFYFGEQKQALLLEGEMGIGGEDSHTYSHPCSLPGGCLASCIRRAEPSSYYDNDGALPSVCAAHCEAKLSII